jgi:site-specific recombinase XerD
MKGNTFQLSFLLRKEKTLVSGEIPIYFRIIINSERAFISTKRSILPEYWDKNKQVAITRLANAAELNEYLLTYKNKIYSSYTELLQSKRRITVDNLKQLLFGDATAPTSIVEVSRLQLEEMKQFLGNGSSYGNLKNYKTTHKYLQEFIPKYYKRKDLPLEEVNYQFLKQYELFLLTEKACKHNGAMKQMQRIKKIINWAMKHRYLSETPFSSYRISFKKYDRGYLTEGEIQQLESTSSLSVKLQYAKDFFMFQLYTGLSYADIIDLKPTDLTEGIDHELWIIKHRVKTQKKMAIPLLPRALEILHRHLDSDKPHVFKKISNQKLNKNLKELGEKAEIKKPLTTHLARHSAATTIWLSNGVSMEAVSEMLGHTKISTTQIYSRVVEKKIADEMNLLK